MSRNVFLAPVVILSLAACNSSLPTDPAGDYRTAQFAATDNSRPFKAECNMQIQAPTVLSPGVIAQVDTGDCRVAHLGGSTLVSDKVINVAAGTQTVKITFTAANGDVLRAEGTGTSSMLAPGIVQFTANVTFTGGTGRFVNASGDAVIRGQAHLAEARSAMVMEGSINY